MSKWFIRGDFMNHWSRRGCDTGEKGQPVQSAASSKQPGASGLQPSRVGSPKAGVDWPWVTSCSHIPLLWVEWTVKAKESPWAKLAVGNQASVHGNTQYPKETGRTEQCPLHLVTQTRTFCLKCGCLASLSQRAVILLHCWWE